MKMKNKFSSGKECDYRFNSIKTAVKLSQKHGNGLRATNL